ncbi:hypothetical protein BMF94_2536 [Rhodotorula taiwanensis]|uniref:Phosphatidylinositol N-acetylglucosaminyltransferase n=1 Tax=Rhodotorula taiwanensis TaxID=741276 RepID=A0A2S5BC51_9BASI|nr:hypothetical protein BMF94_2536 [Rhodotorula taiwanensis]
MLQATKRRRSSGTTTGVRDSEATFVLLPESFESSNGRTTVHDKLRRRTVLDGVAAGRVVLLDSAEGGSLRSIDSGSTPRHRGDEDIVSYGKDDSRGSVARTMTAIFYPSLDPAFIIAAEPVSLDKLAIKPDSVEVSAKRARTAKDDLLEQAVVLLNAHTAEMRVSGNANSRRTGPGRNATALLLRAATAVLAFELPCVGSLSDCTCVGHQLRTRADLVLAALDHPAIDREGLAASLAHIEQLNLLWLCLNDIIVGLALGALVRDHDKVIASGVEHLVRTYVLGYLRDLLQWLSSWPMGIKLNDEIAGLICRAFTGLSNLWEQACLGPVLAHLPIRLIGWTGAFGASTMFALTADLLAFLTLPYFVCYVAATVTFRQSFSFLRALFDVFRGRKYNPLRHRTEPATYEVDALLLGTILFVMLSSIVPTVAAFYLAFASSLLSAAIAILNSFPLFMLLVRFKSPYRLPGRVIWTNPSGSASRSDGHRG